MPGFFAGLGGRVTHVVLNSALVPIEGGCEIDAMQPRHCEGLKLAIEHARRDGTVITLPGPPTVVRLDGGHCPAITDPSSLASVIRSVSPG